MARSAILTIEPIALGGVPTMVKAVDGLLRQWGHTPTLIYTDAESVPTDGPLSLARYFLRHPLPRRERRNGMEGLAIPLLPLPQWLEYYVPLVAARNELARAEVRVSVSGSAHTALPFAVAGKPFVAWVATLYDEEIEARASVGDEWAGRLLRSRDWPKLQQQECRVLESASVVLALSPHTADGIRRRFPQIADRVRVLLCPIDTEAFRPSLTPLAPLPPGEAGEVTKPRRGVRAPFLLFTARIRDPRKNIWMLLRAFARVRAVHPDLKLVFVGDPPLESHLAVRDECGLGDSVIFLPPKPRAELVPFYQAAELFVLSSTQEGLGISLIEALACGLPAVTTRCGGPEGVVVEGETGWLAPNNDEVAFAEAILRALADPDRLRAMRSKCRAFAEKELAKPVVEARLLSALRDVFPQHFNVRTFERSDL